VTNRRFKMANEIPMNPLVAKLARKAESESLVPLKGFLGAAEDEDRVRLYQDLTLADYLEVARADVVHVTEGETETDPATTFVRANARIAVVSKSTTRAETLDPTPNPWQVFRVLRPAPHPWMQDIGMPDGSYLFDFVSGFTAQRLHPTNCAMKVIWVLTGEGVGGPPGSYPVIRFKPVFVLDCE